MHHYWGCIGSHGYPNRLANSECYCCHRSHNRLPLNCSRHHYWGCIGSRGYPNRPVLNSFVGPRGIYIPPLTDKVLGYGIYITHSFVTLLSRHSMEIYIILLFIAGAFVCSFCYIYLLHGSFSMHRNCPKTSVIPQGIIICQPDYSNETPVIIKI